MRIDGSHVSPVSGHGAYRAAQQQNAPTATRSVDSAELSQRALGVRRAQAAAADAPDSRNERVAAIRGQIQSGSYQISNSQIAAKLLPSL